MSFIAKARVTEITKAVIAELEHNYIVHQLNARFYKEYAMPELKEKQKKAKGSLTREVEGEIKALEEKIEMELGVVENTKKFILTLRKDLD